MVDCNIIMLLIPVLIAVESGGNPNALGDFNPKTGEYEAVGILQIHKCIVDDVSKWFPEDNLQYGDRTYKVISEIICRRYLWHWGEHYKGITGKSATAEVLARIWKGGPNGWKKKSTEKYWLKVKKEMEKTK